MKEREEFIKNPWRADRRGSYFNGLTAKMKTTRPPTGSGFSFEHIHLMSKRAKP
jgi:hypothetical protein